MWIYENLKPIKRNLEFSTGMGLADYEDINSFG